MRKTKYWIDHLKVEFSLSISHNWGLIFYHKWSKQTGAKVLLLSLYSALTKLFLWLSSMWVCVCVSFPPVLWRAKKAINFTRAALWNCLAKKFIQLSVCCAEGNLGIIFSFTTDSLAWYEMCSLRPWPPLTRWKSGAKSYVVQWSTLLLHQLKWLCASAQLTELCKVSLQRKYWSEVMFDERQRHFWKIVCWLVHFRI